MKVYKNATILIPVILVLIFLIWISFDRKVDNNTNNEIYGYHSAIFFEEKTFFDEILRLVDKKEIEGFVLGGVIPHHLLASDIITGFFSNIPNNQLIERVVLIGPNHYELGDSIFITSRYIWETPVGNVSPDLKLIDKLNNSGLDLEINEDVMEQEHSMGGIMPFISHYLPNASVVPISISNRSNLSDIENLALILTEEVNNKKTIFISSVDFSHYLSLVEAEENDKKILEILKNGDMETLLELDEDYVDSPESLALLLLLMNNQGITSFKVRDHKNSADYTNETEAETTSYYSFMFIK